MAIHYERAEVYAGYTGCCCARHRNVMIEIRLRQQMERAVQLNMSRRHGKGFAVSQAIKFLATK